MNLKMLWWLPVIAVLGILMHSLAASVPDSEKAAAREKIQKGAKVVDVRTPDEFAAGHYAGAVSIPLQELEKRLSDVGPTNKPVVVYCLSGHRAGVAKQILLKAGFTDVTNAGRLADMPK